MRLSVYKKELLAKFICHIILIAGSAVMLLPFLWMISTSLKQLGEVFVFPPTFFGEKLIWENYLKIASRFNYFRYFFNSLKISAWVVFFQLFTSAMAGFCFARLQFKVRDKLFILYLATMMIPFQVTIIPNFLQMKLYNLLNTHWSLMIPPMVSAFGTFLMRQFFITVPTELDEAAKIDGCTPFGVFIRILLPMAQPVIATLAIFCFMGIWNDYFTPLIYLNNETLYTLPLGLAKMKGMYSTDWPVLMASTFISILPVLVAFLCAQDAFVKGIMLSGLKD
ncbi:carbohydrate ABC transporter permease [Cellulosilyticum sp. I15G10I2]|uniref:carbohydrate ABC transporter permease n=1 Tax=Cellulosilyticum sp. I15G10I2 TaxID=1892843 RepID=UPI00085CAA26|nr:carbohydrate ABC transporter permease [Cellulosilyticum sp. I15G10I2]